MVFFKLILNSGLLRIVLYNNVYTDTILEIRCVYYSVKHENILENLVDYLKNSVAIKFTKKGFIRHCNK
jgi:hypothetical protein